MGRRFAFDIGTNSIGFAVWRTADRKVLKSFILAGNAARPDGSIIGVGMSAAQPYFLPHPSQLSP